MIYKIKKELNKTYLIICGNDEISNDYRVKMLSDNQISGLIPIEIRSINGKKQLYYDITGKINIVKLTLQRNVNFDDIVGLFAAIKATVEELNKHLLDGEYLVYEPDLIMKDMKTNQYEMICIPSAGDGYSLVELAELLVENVCAEDEYGVKAAYQLYEMVNEGIDDIKILFDAITEIGKDIPKEEVEQQIIEEVLIDEEEEETIEEVAKYRPSFNEIFIAAASMAGISCIGLWTYLSFFTNNILY